MTLHPRALAVALICAGGLGVGAPVASAAAESVPTVPTVPTAPVSVAWPAVPQLPALTGAGPSSLGPCSSTAGQYQQGATAGTTSLVCTGAGLTFIGPAIGQVATVIGPTIIGPAVVTNLGVSAGNVGIG